jgi:hypothetical protein
MQSQLLVVDWLEVGTGMAPWDHAVPTLLARLTIMNSGTRTRINNSGLSKQSKHCCLLELVPQCQHQLLSARNVVYILSLCFFCSSKKILSDKLKLHSTNLAFIVCAVGVFYFELK